MLLWLLVTKMPRDRVRSAGCGQLRQTSFFNFSHFLPASNCNYPCFMNPAPNFRPDFVNYARRKQGGVGRRVRKSDVHRRRLSLANCWRLDHVHSTRCRRRETRTVDVKMEVAESGDHVSWRSLGGRDLVQEQHIPLSATRANYQS